MTKDYNKITLERKIFMVDWVLSSVCNYNCSYCSPDLHDGKYRFPNLDAAKKFVRDVKKLRHDREITYALSGGEPTLWKDLPKLIEFIRKTRAVIIIVSNGSASVEWWKKNTKYFGTIILSYHWEKVDKDHIIKVCQTIVNEKGNVALMIPVLPDRFQEAFEVGEEISNKVQGVFVRLRALRKNQAEHVYDYTEEQIKILNDKSTFGSCLSEINFPNLITDTGVILHPNDLVFNKENSWTGWRCYIGLEEIKIEIDGVIRKGGCNSAEVIGHINGNWKLPTEPVICNQNYCGCATDIKVTKERII